MQGEDIRPSQGREEMLRAVLISAAKAMRAKDKKGHEENNLIENMLVGGGTSQGTSDTPTSQDSDTSKESETIDKAILNFSPKIKLKRVISVEKDKESSETAKETSEGVEKEGDRLYFALRRLRDFVYVLKNGYPRPQSDIIVDEDYDLLPKGHRLHANYQTYHHIKYDFFTDMLYYDEFRAELSGNEEE